MKELKRTSFKYFTTKINFGMNEIFKIKKGEKFEYEKI